MVHDSAGDALEIIYGESELLQIDVPQVRGYRTTANPQHKHSMSTPATTQYKTKDSEDVRVCWWAASGPVEAAVSAAASQTEPTTQSQAVTIKIENAHTQWEQTHSDGHGTQKT